MSRVASLGIVAASTRMAAKARRGLYEIELAPVERSTVGACVELRVFSQLRNSSAAPAADIVRLNVWPVGRPHSVIGYSRSRSIGMRSDAYKNMNVAARRPGGASGRGIRVRSTASRKFLTPS